MGAVRKCEICSAPATVFLTQVINGKSTKFCLCAKCAQKRGLLNPDAFDLAEKLFPDIKGQLEYQLEQLSASLDDSENKDKKGEDVGNSDKAKKSGAGKKKEPKEPRAKKRRKGGFGESLTGCPTCSYPLQEFKKTGLLGCSECYKAFASDIYALLEGDSSLSEWVEDDHALGDSSTLGKNEAQKDKGESNREKAVRELEGQLALAIAREDYKRAAQLRDAIQMLKTAPSH